MKVKKLDAADLRKLINEALSEELAGLKEDDHKEAQGLDEDAETDADAEKMRTAAAEEEDKIATMSESAHLERWKKLAGLLTD